MRALDRFEGLVDGLPPWGQIVLALCLVAFSVLSVYGRINTRFGGKIFSKIPDSEIRTNSFHILRYTIIPVIITLGYLTLLLKKYFLSG